MNRSRIYSYRRTLCRRRSPCQISTVLTCDGDTIKHIPAIPLRFWGIMILATQLNLVMPIFPIFFDHQMVTLATTWMLERVSECINRIQAFIVLSRSASAEGPLRLSEYGNSFPNVFCICHRVGNGCRRHPWAVFYDFFRYNDTINSVISSFRNCSAGQQGSRVCGSELRRAV